MVVTAAEADVLARLRSGDQAAFRDLVGRNHAAMIRFASGFVPSGGGTVPTGLSLAASVEGPGPLHVSEPHGERNESPHATTVYAWSALTDGTSERGFYTVLGKPPINSAADAVRAGIVAEHRSQR